MKSTIEWTGRVWNFLTGCTRISQGCKFCYMFLLAMRLKAMGQEKYRNGTKLTIHEHVIANPYNWKKPSLVFVNSMSDIFHEDVPDSVLIAAWEVMNETPQHTYQILTKRPERLLEMQDKVVWTDNIWMGVSIENDEVIYRAEYLRKSIAKVKWISAEPLLGSVKNLDLTGINWIVVGGEAGISKKIRPIKREWVIEILKQCREKEIPFFFKQWGKKAFNPDPSDPTTVKGHPQYAKGGCQLDGKVYREFPIITNSSNNLNEINTITMQQKRSKSEMTQIVSKLSPFKRLIGEALIQGENPEALADRLAISRPMPRKTAQAYITMVNKLLNGPNPQATDKPAPLNEQRTAYDLKPPKLKRIDKLPMPVSVPILETLYCDDSEEFDDFIENAKKRGYDYYVHGFPGEDSQSELIAVCKGKPELVEVCLAMSKDYCFFIEEIKYFEDFQLN